MCGRIIRRIIILKMKRRIAIHHPTLLVTIYCLRFDRGAVHIVVAVILFQLMFEVLQRSGSYCCGWLYCCALLFNV
jgi:hypothetical protein